LSHPNLVGACDGLHASREVHGQPRNDAAAELDLAEVNTD
jgi:hypothetical protein